jgi:hypothetical protein
MLLFLIFFPRSLDGEPNDPADSDSDFQLPTWKEAILVLALSLTFFIVAFLGSVIFVYALPTHVRAWANFLGILGTVLAAVQYLPQIYTTYKLQQVGSLSVPMMCIQTPGSFVFAASLAVRLGSGGWSAWGLFILTGCLQGCLLSMALGFLWRDRKAAKKGLGAGREEEQGAHEETPLLGNGTDGEGTR